MTYTIRLVPRPYYWTTVTILKLHDASFEGSAPRPDLSEGSWWLVWDDDHAPVAFAGLTVEHDRGYLCRVGVLPLHQGHGLHLRLIRAREHYARGLGLTCMVSDTSPSNHPSSNNLIRAGYRLYTPKRLWAFRDSLYWRKPLG